MYKILNKMYYVKWTNKLLEKNRGVESDPAGNMSRQGICFHMELGKISNIRDLFS